MFSSTFFEDPSCTETGVPARSWNQKSIRKRSAFDLQGHLQGSRKGSANDLQTTCRPFSGPIVFIPHRIVFGVQPFFFVTCNFICLAVFIRFCFFCFFVSVLSWLGESAHPRHPPEETHDNNCAPPAAARARPRRTAARHHTANVRAPLA